MNKITYDQQKLRAFLLGALADEEAAELFDELSFTDDSFAEELSAAEKELVDAYVGGELTGGELESFENHYLASPLRRAKVEFAQAFRSFAEKKIPQTEIETAEEKASKRGFGEIFAAWNIFGSLRYALQFGLVAAVLLFMILGGWFWSENRRLSEQASETEQRRDAILQRELELQKQLETEQDQNAQTADELARLREERQRLEEELNLEKTRKEQIIAAQKKAAQKPRPMPSAPQSASAPSRLSIASFILTPPLRGATQIPDLSIPAKTDIVAAQLQLESDAYAAYRVALVGQSGQTLWRSGRMRSKPGAAGRVLSVRIPAKILKSQVYSLVVSGNEAGGEWEEISSYPIRVVLD